MLRDELQSRLERALEENTRLREENRRLRQQLGLFSPAAEPTPTLLEPKDGDLGLVINSSASQAKIALFRSLFRGREDVFALRWESKNGKSGYSPVCLHEWDRRLCDKPKIRCAECKNREFELISDATIGNHLSGKHTVGIYPLLTDETCWFLAMDFDKADWRQDVKAFWQTCEEMHVPSAVERSRSGNGAHVWFFFDRPVSAELARKLGCVLLTRAMDKRHQIGLDSYDRLFPSQDIMPKGGLGNLIALPLQHKWLPLSTAQASQNASPTALAGALSSNSAHCGYKSRGHAPN